MPRLAILPFVVSALPAQIAWTNLQPPAAPSARTEVQMLSDGGGALLFGGLHGPSQVAFDELWRFDGSNWSLQAPTGSSPPARSRFAAAFDPVRQRLVVFGGDGQYTTNGTMGDTWEWDPTTSTWLQLQPATMPTPRIHARMTYDLLSGTMLMFGGNGSAGSETWAWDGVDWTQRTPANVPPPRQQPGLATDWTTGKVVMFGGSTGAASGILADTWVWDGADWNQVTTSNVPGGSGIRNGRLAYDQLRQRMVLFGGVRGSGGFSNEVWEFDGVDWTQRMPTTAPAGRAGLGLCYVESLQTSVLFGGYNGGFFADTWELQTDAVATNTPFGSGCSSSVGVPTLQVAPEPWLGESLTWTVGNLPPNGLPILLVGLSNTAWSAGALPFHLAVLGFPACDLLVSTETATFVPTPLSLPIPNDPTLIAFSMHAQAVVLVPNAQGFDLSATGGVTSVIGAR